MLKRLTVSNLAIVERAEAEFASGLNVITGETGSGKSVLIGALDLALGGKADAGAVRDGAKEAEVEAEFDECVIRRTVTSSGRTRAWVDDESVTLGELRELGRRLVDIHGPRANQQVLEEGFQRSALDAYGSLAAETVAYAAAYAELGRIRGEIEALNASAAGDISGEMDMLRYQVDELAGAGLSPADEDIAARHAAAAHAGEIVEEANAVTEGLGGDEGAAELLIRLQPHFRTLARHLPEAADWAAQAEELTLRVQELSRTVADAASRIDVGEDDLAELDARLTVVSKLRRKYGVSAVADLLALLDRKRARLDELEHRGERLEELERARAVAEGVVRKAGAKLTKARQAAGAKLAKAVTEELRDLGFLQAKFFVNLEAAAPEAHGCDRVVYMFEPNPGESARPLAATASSGEAARVMLALKSVLSAHDPVGLLVFDEIDANIGGEVGRAVGEKLRAVAGRHQVVAITHLPQSAAYGDRHLVVSKSVSGGRTRTEVASVKGEARVSELVRMLGGEGTTGAVRRHARELLKAKG